MHRLPLRALTVLLAALAVGGTAPAAAQEGALTPLPRDPHSYARPDEARVTHVALDLDADFEAHVLAGTATLTYAAAPGTDAITLDTRDLTIEAVTDPEGRRLDTVIGPADPVLGQPLIVMLPHEGDRIVVHYRTNPEADAVQWLTPAQTASGHPYLFTQGEAILTRTWIPTQDSPGIRQTYEATITVPEGLTAVMSAEGNTTEGTPVGDGRTAFHFRMDHPIPPYLIALAAGDLAFRALGPRTGVWTEPQVLDAAAYEFADLEQMVDAAEALYGPYRWGRYDVLVLPPSFPYGGMENPRLTFATPTVLAGDRSLVSLVAHELAHSWSGNLVTNATWADSWLNEGVTTYIENRIMEAVYGADYARMLELLGRQELQDDLDALPAEDTRLHLDLASRDPDAGLSNIAYDKGAAFLRTIEVAAGRARFDAFLRRYFDEHAFQPMTTEGFLDYLDRELIRGDDALRAQIRPEEWAYETGLPDNVPPVTSEAFARVEAQAEAFVNGTPPGELATEGWTTHEWLHFLQALPDTLTRAQLLSLDHAFGFTETSNSEILFAWLMRAIENRYDIALPALERFLMGQGRRKFVLPLYTALAETEWGRPLAERIYEHARPGYHPVTANSVDAVLGAPAGG